MLVRFVALALVGSSLAEVGLYVAVCHEHALPIQIPPCLFRSLPLLAGVVMLLKARSLAAWVADKLD